jgi:hypothetical protein
LSFLRATSRESLFDQFKKPYDVVHFYGHGEVIDGIGNLAFVSDASSSEQAVTDFVPAPELVRLLAGTPIRLVIHNSSRREKSPLIVASASRSRYQRSCT